MTATVFLVFLFVVVAAVAIAVSRALPRGESLPILVGLFLWLAYVGAMSWSGLVASPTLRPPPAVLVALPAFLVTVLVLAPLRVGLRIAQSFPVWLLIGAQVFRVGVEMLLHQLWRDGLVPRLMTYEGGNLDILTGLSAPLVAWIATRGRVGLAAAQLWNGVGLIALANIVVRAVLTAPGPLQTLNGDVPNLAIGTFPFTYIAAFFAPLAFALHVLAIRAIRAVRLAPLVSTPPVT
ncbi:hypothetical protein; putative membrane protein [Bradyrhizobium sp. ORS 278]|uniref:hypothetical protein n=1 Tax=Bradyrhizobium sp. (strain ORS 278) TaxID=114615 RepID=UPI0001508E84|nr:hypothetical protein [Bradyrhizobium sp. ORS 278]CAL78372.1 hypothetical protein; putative membrane protein [Bradyrhizobium sp. ORS 278]